MAFVADLYNDTNKHQQYDANQLIQSLLDDNSQKNYDIILDIGSGSGNVTKQLCQKIPHKRIIAIDIDPQMTQFARNNYPSNTIEYITQDISKTWDELDTCLKELEGKVSLVFSNRVLHWVEDKETAAKNISKFLATNGDIRINITAIHDVTQHLSEELKEKFIKFPSIDEQFEIWRKNFTNEGIELSLAKIKYIESFYDRNIIEAMFPTTPKMYEIYMKSKDSEYRKKIINTPEYINVVNDKWFLGWNQEFKPNAYQDFRNSGNKGIISNIGQFQFFGTKKLYIN